jgi:hypothetical protein
MEASERYWPDWNSGSRPSNGLMAKKFLTLRHSSTSGDGKKFPKGRFPKMSEHGKSRGERQNDSALKLKILEWIDRLSTHFNSPQDEEQIKIFLHALRNNTVYQVHLGFERCLNECQFMPKLADVHARMPEQRYATENPGRFFQKKPLLDIIRPIAEEICMEVCGCEYLDLQDAKQIEFLFKEANTIRYLRMGVGGKWLKPTERQLAIAARKPFTDWANI